MTKEVKVVVSADANKFQKGMGDAEKATNKLHSALDRFGPVGSGIANLLGKLGFSSVGMAGAVTAGAIAIGAAAKIAEDSIRQYMNLGDAVRRYSQITGQSAEASTRQVFAFKELGVDADTVAAGMFKLARAADNAKDPLGTVGINVAKDANGAVDLNATLLNVISAWQGTGDAAKQAAIIFAAFGKSGAAMLPILETNSAELRRLEAQVQLVFTQADLEAIRKYKVAENELKQSNDDLGLSIGRALLPAQTAAVEAMNENIYVNEHLAQSQEYQTAVANHNRIATMNLAEAMREQYRASLAARDAQTALADSMKQAAQEAQQEADAELKLYDALHKNIDANFAYQQSILDLNNAFKTAKDLHFKDAQANLKLQESIVAVADAAVAMAEAQAEANGTTLTASEKADIFRAKLKALEKQFPALKSTIDAYISALSEIPASVSTTVKVRGINQAGGAAAHGNLSFDKGGIVPGPTGAPVPAIVHGGEEVIPVGGHRGGGGGTHIHYHIGTLIATDPDFDALSRRLLQRGRFAPGT